jgi:hypothetical protein
MSIVEAAVAGLAVERVPLRSLTPHPRNYRQHPDDQLTHLEQSLRQFGWYRNIVTARDLTILAGHGIALAAARLGWEEAPIHRLDLDPEEPAALKVLTADNELARFAENDDRLLSELLREVKEQDLSGLLGTGYDEAMLANLVMVTRPASEIADFDEAAHWVGMPDYEGGLGRKPKLVIAFPDDAARERFVSETELAIDKRQAQVWTTRWPFTPREDLASLRFEG